MEGYITTSKGSDSATNQLLFRWYLIFFFNLMWPLNHYIAKALKNISRVHRADGEKACPGQGLQVSIMSRPLQRKAAGSRGAAVSARPVLQHEKGAGLQDAPIPCLQWALAGQKELI